ncbi:hypothetical protein Tco_0679493 [Tanacetum coccineum]|uniref:Uncharacterized protein n=1 Tax=Tanacetum coccineum TaxID=301880 RepID=A0ABQ4XI09_9ASTR
MLSPPLPVSSPPLPVSPTYPLGYRAAMIWMSAETLSTSHLLPSINTTMRDTTTPTYTFTYSITRYASSLYYLVSSALPPPLAERPTGGFRADYGFVGTLDDKIRLIGNYGASTTDGDCRVAGSRPHLTGTACGDTDTDEDTTDIGDSTPE